MLENYVAGKLNQDGRQGLTNFKSIYLMSLVSNKKSYLVCVELTNFRIFTQPIPNFFSKYKTETANRGQRQLLFLTSRFRQI